LYTQGSCWVVASMLDHGLEGLYKSVMIFLHYVRLVNITEVSPERIVYMVCSRLVLILSSGLIIIYLSSPTIGS
jgi:hypothetical protein